MQIASRSGSSVNKKKEIKCNMGNTTQALQLF